MRVAIAGGGLAGLACAKSLVDAGHEVELFESLPYFGGRASTYRDEDGDWIEQGLHLCLGQYREFLRLLDETGIDAGRVLFWTTALSLHDAGDGTSATFGVNPARAPLRTVLSALTQTDYLDYVSRAALVAMFAPALAPWGVLRGRFDDETVADWWLRCGGRQQLMDRVLRPLCRGLQFSEPEQYSAYNLLGLVHHVLLGILNNRLGGYDGARDATIFRPIVRWLERKDARLHSGTAVRTIRYAPSSGRVTGLRLGDGHWARADAYVMALPVWLLRPLVPSALAGTRFFAALGRLPIAPAISVQLWLNRRVCDDEAFHLVARSPAPVFQDQSRRTYPTRRGSRLSFIVSPADDLLDEEDDAIVARTLSDFRAVVPAAREARVTKAVVLRHPRHLVRPLPGAMGARPPQTTPVPNLFFAGDWTQQDFFGSQEGAVRGGRQCARAVLEALEDGRLAARGE